ncbi:hypothetical protein AK812_SmicGene46147, partial [Symbiodinium microadriaticum]
ARPASTLLSADEETIRGAAETFATEILAPKVQDMDRDSKMSPEIVQVPEDLGGVGMGFTASCLAIE